MRVQTATDVKCYIIKRAFFGFCSDSLGLHILFEHKNDGYQTVYSMAYVPREDNIRSTDKDKSAADAMDKIKAFLNNAKVKNVTDLVDKECMVFYNSENKIIGVEVL